MTVEVLGLCFSSAEGAPFSHNGWLVALSYVTAFLASFTALSLADRLQAAHGRAWIPWLVSASVALGGGIWSMHFVAMLAFDTIVPVTYNIAGTAISLLIPILVVAAGLYAVRRPEFISWHRVVIAGVVVGIGIAAMHYTGMAAMRFPGTLAYKPFMFALSVLIAVVAAIGALGLAFRPLVTWQRLVAALIMAVAICGLHYTSMSGLVIQVDPLSLRQSPSLSKPFLAMAVAAGTYSILLLGVVSAMADRRLGIIAAREAQRLRSANFELANEVAVRRRVEADLKASRAELETRVEERTKELRALAYDLDEARARAEAANAGKSRFLAAASHDLRQPLQSMFLLVGSLTKSIRDERGREKVRHLERSMTALRDLLNGMLDVARLDTGSIKTKIENFSLRDVLDEIASSQAMLATAKGLEWRYIPCDAVVYSDRILLSRILRNLVENAIRYTEQGFVELACNICDGQVCISVRDSGIGIPKNHIDRIFDEFHQVGNPERDRTQGVGLGLAIVRRLSAVLHHPVSVDSTVGAGSSFHVRVPIGKGQTEVAATDGPAWTFGKGRTVVVIEDEVNVRAGLVALLEDAGFSVIAAGATDEAITLLSMAGIVPNILLADFRLREGSNGAHAIARIRDTVGKPVPGVILTGDIGPDVETEAETHGLMVLRKPISSSTLIHVLDRQVEASIV